MLVRIRDSDRRCQNINKLKFSHRRIACSEFSTFFDPIVKPVRFHYRKTPYYIYFARLTFQCWLWSCELQTIHILNGWLNASSTFYKWNAILALISMWMNVSVINSKREPFPLVSTIVYLTASICICVGLISRTADRTVIKQGSRSNTYEFKVKPHQFFFHMFCHQIVVTLLYR